ncbi:uncharacterized protein LODBEIA_P07310 [Lodderomyces beijingensis]|uniref:DASH complex subunit DAM1 n=1 Tax=Lodderomyces beijingensis TaxID=1775926 RepID=A0ABP0ZED3_9ASCO
MLQSFKLLAEAMDDLDVNMRDLSHIHTAISSNFNEPFASLLYGLSITMWCVDFPRVPTRQQWEQIEIKERKKEEIAQLRRKLEEAEQANVQLRKKLDEETKLGNLSRPSDVKRSPLAKSNKENYGNSGGLAKNGKSTTVSRIPQPIFRPVTATNTTTSSTGGNTTLLHKSAMPNLNQPPRYMRGLFENSSFAKSAGVTKPAASSATTGPRRPLKTSQRPPFR